MKKDSTPTSTRTKKAGTPRRGKEAAKALGEVLKAEDEEPTLTLTDLKDAEQSLTDDSRKILDFLLKDAVNDDVGASSTNTAVTKAIRSACARAQMNDRGTDEVTFFRHVTDPGFMSIVKNTGQALVGAHILPLVATLLNIAIEERKQWAMTACLKIAGLLPTQYDIYQLKYEFTHNNNINGDIDFGGKTDKELKNIIAHIDDEPSADEASG